MFILALADVSMNRIPCSRAIYFFFRNFINVIESDEKCYIETSNEIDTYGFSTFLVDYSFISHIAFISQYHFFYILIRVLRTQLNLLQIEMKCTEIRRMTLDLEQLTKIRDRFTLTGDVTSRALINDWHSKAIYFKHFICFTYLRDRHRKIVSHCESMMNFVSQ